MKKLVFTKSVFDKYYTDKCRKIIQDTLEVCTEEDVLKYGNDELIITVNKLCELHDLCKSVSNGTSSLLTLQTDFLFETGMYVATSYKLREKTILFISIIKSRCGNRRPLMNKFELVKTVSFFTTKILNIDYDFLKDDNLDCSWETQYKAEDVLTEFILGLGQISEDEFSARLNNIISSKINLDLDEFIDTAELILKDN